MLNSILSSKIKTLPLSPGVYIYKDAKGVIIYVGKAKRLRTRVQSYFRLRKDLGEKTAVLVNNVFDLDHIATASELEALILEAELIKKYKPKFNIQLKDDKSYLYIVIRQEKVTFHGNPLKLHVVKTARKPDLRENDIFFGPFPDATSVKYIVKLLRKVIPFRDCSPNKFSKHNKSRRPCLYGDLQLCSVPCLSLENIKIHRGDIEKIRSILQGNSTKIYRDFEKKMKLYAAKNEFEQAAKYRDILKKFDYITSDFWQADKYIENPNLLQDTAEMAMKSIKSALPFLKNLPIRIECYDISNLSGKDAVGSMVVATNGHIDKTSYRKFRIKTKSTPDDFFMLQEVLTRRLKREISPDPNRNWGMPDLLVMDGGKGQISAVSEVLKSLNLDIPIIGLAKRFETIVYKKGDNFVSLSLPKDHPGLKLLINLRDEAHRFAQAYHHKLRRSSIILV